LQNEKICAIIKIRIFLRRMLMKKILSLFLAVLMIASVFTAVPVMAEEDVVVLNENYGKVKVTGKVQSNGSIAFGVRSAFGDSETQDVIQYFVSPRGDETSYGMENNQAFDFYSGQELVEKTSSTVFGSGTKGGGDEEHLFLFQASAGLVQAMV
jgi:hypothetical protein